jgi:putative PEP-CTERM system TPR-repeat lipoprotein
MSLVHNKLVILFCGALALSACSPNKTADENIASAKIHISNNQNAEALIELKNAIRSDLKNAEARFLLGSLYLQRGEAAAAEKELQKALTLGASEELVMTKLLKSMSLQEKEDEIIAIVEQNQDLPVKVLPAALLYQALAYTQIGEKKKAILAIERANEISEESVYSQLGGAYIKANADNIDGALNTLEAILIKSPNLTEALLLQGQLLVIKEDFSAAIIAFERYFTLLPANIKIRLYLANAYINNNQFDQADRHLDFILKAFPHHGFTNQLKGAVYFQKEDYKQALMHTEKAIQNGINTLSNRVVAGLSAFKLQEYERAHQFLAAVTDGLPSNHPALRVLAIVQLQLGYSEDAAEILSQFDGALSMDLNLFTSASLELLKSGKTNEAKSLLNKADGVTFENAEDMTRVGLLKLSMNDIGGIANLEKAADIAPDSSVAKIALASAYITNKEFGKALLLGEKWKKVLPNQVGGYNLIAKVLLLQGKVAAAEAELRSALVLEESNSLSLLYFAAKGLREGKPEEAIGSLDKVLNTNPDNIKALDLYYRANKAIGNEAVAIRNVVSSFENNKESAAYRLLYAKVLFIEQDFEKVIELLKNIEDRKSTLSLHWMLLSDSYLNTKQSTKALDLIDNWIEAKPQHRAAWLRKISIQETLDDFLGALSTVDSVLEFNSKDEQFTVLRSYYLIRNKQFKNAQMQIDSLTEKLKSLPLIQGLQGQIWLTEGKYAQALPGLRALYEKLPTPYNAALFFATLKELKQDKKAFDFLINHVKARPNDYMSRTLLAEKAMVFDKYLAKKHYLILLKKSPNSLSILNNLAWVEYELTNYQVANEFSERALALNDNHPQVLDTAGLIKLKLGDKKSAVTMLKKASKLLPADKKIAKHYQEAIN